MLDILNHPLITHKLTLMRNKETGTKDFRENLDEIAELMAYEVCRDLPVRPIDIETPIGPCVGYELSKEVIIVPILRAGIGLLDGIVVSGEEMTMKPRPEMYRILLDRYGLKAEECVFIDDNPRNAEGAEAVGIRGIIFRDAAQLRAELSGLLGDSRSSRE